MGEFSKIWSQLLGKSRDQCNQYHNHVVGCELKYAQGLDLDEPQVHFVEHAN